MLIKNLVSILMVAANLTSISALHAQLLTDNFAARPETSSSTVTFNGNTTSATSEVGEPNHGGFRLHSVWGAWTAPGNGNVTISTSGSSFDTVLAVYVGTALSNLLPVAQNNDVQTGFTWSSVTFPTKSGVTYSFAVDGSPNGVTTGQGSVVVNLAFTSGSQPGAEIGTDSFAARPTLPSALQAIGTCDTRLATIELDEPDGIGFKNQTVWWRWVAPSNGLVTIDTLASGVGFDTALTVYVGNMLTNLSEVAINDNAPNVLQSRVAFQARAGQEYQVMVDGFPNSTSAGQGNLILNLSLQPNFEPGAVPGFDHFAQRGLLGGINARGAANNTFYGVELNEPNHGSFRNHTTWWQWTAPADGPVDIKTEGSDFDTFLAVYTGAALTSLQLVASNNNGTNVTWSEVKFNAQHGVNYQIMVDGAPNSTSAGQGNIVLSVNQAVPAINTMAIYAAVEVEIPGNLGVNYQIQSSPDLISWVNIGGPMLGQGQPVRILDPSRGTNKKFYRYLTLP